MTHQESVEATFRNKSEAELRTFAYDNSFTSPEYREAAKAELIHRQILADCWTCGANLGEPGHALDEPRMIERHRTAGHDVHERKGE